MFSSWSSGFCFLWPFVVVSRVVIFSSFSFEGVGFLLTTGPWFWLLLFKFVFFWLLSEISSVLLNATGWSYVTGSVLTVSALVAVRRVCFGVLYSRSSFGSCHMVASSLGIWPCRLKYDWALILRVICHLVAGLPDYRCFAMAHCSHLRGFFIPLRAMLSDTGPFFCRTFYWILSSLRLLWSR